MTLLHLLDEYEALVQQHREQFTPALSQLQASVNETLHQLQQQERPLVEAQAQQLTDLQHQLATDARCLLNSVELQAFVAEVQALRTRSRWHQNKPPLEIDASPANWQLAQTDFTLAIRDYKTRIDHDAYDDERTHTTYSHRVTIQIGDYSEHIEILTQRVYSPVEQHLYTLPEQLDYYVEDEVAGLLRQQGMEDAAKTQLAREIGYLLGCAAQLLALTPQTVQFQYPGAEVAA